MENKPNIRFKGFTDDWEQRKFEEIAVRSSVICSDANLPRVEYEDIVSGAGRLNKDIYAKQSSKSGIAFHQGDVLYGKLRPYLQNWLLPTFDGLAVGDFWVLQPQNADSSFLYRLIQSRQFDEVANQSTGTKMPRADWKLVSKTVFSIPSNISEQATIGTYFTALDHLITLHQRQCDDIKQLKKYMLQKMFPRKDQNVPEIRFDGFSDDWEQRKVLDLLIQPITDGPHETPKLVEEGVPFISVDAIVDNKIDFNRKRGNISEEYDELCCKKYKPQFHDVYLVKSGSTVGKVAIVETTDRFNIWSPLAAMRCGEKTYPYFLYDLLQTKDLQAQVADKASNGTQPNLSMRELEKFPVSVPLNLEEQKKIGDYFRNLDHLITLHQHKCNQLNELKKYMLSNMFPKKGA